MSTTMLTYEALDSPIHKLTGATKLIVFILWSIASMMTYDTRLLLLLFVLSIIIFTVSRVPFKSVAFVLYFILFFLVLNNVAIFLFAPDQGTAIYGTRHVLWPLFAGHAMTQEQLFYQMNMTLKYFSVIPMALLFIVTTDPSEFAASLNKIGVNYKIAYAVAIALRYIPDIQRDYQDISFAQQARGIDMSRKEKLHKRIKNASAILMPLILSSLERIEVISSAMELRCFGNQKKRTWYKARPFTLNDFIAIGCVVLLLGLSIAATVLNGGRFYNPFI